MLRLLKSVWTYLGARLLIAGLVMLFGIKGANHILSTLAENHDVEQELLKCRM